MRILFISPRQCWPAMGGSKLRDYHSARALGERESITYLFFRDPAFDPPRAEDLPFCEKIVPVPPPRFYSPGRIARGVLSRWPLPVINYTSDEMKSAIASELRTGSWDAIHFEGIHMAAYLSGVRQLAANRPITFNWHNIESEGMQRYALQTSSPLKRAYAGLTARRLAAVEDSLLRGVTGNFVCSERERIQLLGQVPGARVAVVENGVDSTYFQDQPPGTQNRILFVGLMAYHANADAAVAFTRNIWPGLRDRLPGKTLTIVGANPTPAVLELQNEPAVEVTGTVPDVRPYYADAFAAVVPLRVGAGTRLKILEAMAAGVPVVSTALGAEGLNVRSGENILLAESDEEWLQALTSLTDHARRQAIVQEARSLVRARYDWRMIRESFYSIYRDWLRTA